MSGKSFFDTYVDVSTGSWINAEEKQVLMDNAIPLKITGITEDPAPKFEPRYIVQALVVNPETGDEEERKVGFPIGTVESRDHMLISMQAALAEGIEIEPVILTKVGNSIIIRKAT